MADDTVRIEAWPKDPLATQMSVTVHGDEPFPVCIKLCEPICVKSEYTIAIDIFDRPVGVVTLRGTTRLFACPEEE